MVVSAPTRALIMLAYLFDVNRSVTRRELASLLWAGFPDVAATNLRSTLRRLAQATASANCSLVNIDGSMLSVNQDALRCDLDMSAISDPLERLKCANDAIAMQFLPLEGKGEGQFDLWVRDVRLRLVGRLRAEFLALRESSDASRARSELKRAAILLLEQDPHDEEVRKALADEQEPGNVRYAITQPAYPNIVLPAQINPGQFDVLAAQRPRIALLPPETAPDADRFGSVANAMIEDLTIDLCVSRSVSVVAPYTSVQIQSSNDKAAVLQRHNVIYVLDTKRSDNLLFVQLIFTPTDEIVWASRFQLAPEALVQQRKVISSAIEQAIVERIDANARYVSDYKQKPEAYFSYLRGLQSLSTLALPSIRKARRHFKEALEYDKNFAAALAGLSRTLIMEWLLTARGDNDLIREAERLSTVAIKATDQFAGGFKELGVSRLYMNAFDESLDALHQAEVISPNYADVLCSYADSLTHAGNPAAALEKMSQAISLNPLAPDLYFWTAAGACYFLRDYQQALTYIDRMRDIGPASRLASASWGMLGETAKARAYRNRVLKVTPDFDLERWLKMIPFKEPWQTELYREGFKKAGF